MFMLFHLVCNIHPLLVHNYNDEMNLVMLIDIQMHKWIEDKNVCIWLTKQCHDMYYVVVMVTTCIVKKEAQTI